LGSLLQSLKTPHLPPECVLHLLTYLLAGGRKELKDKIVLVGARKPNLFISLRLLSLNLLKRSQKKSLGDKKYGIAGLFGL
jgi:hypothetical protein